MHGWRSQWVRCVLGSLIVLLAVGSKAVADDEADLSAVVAAIESLEKQHKSAEQIPLYDRAVKLATHVYGADHPYTGGLQILEAGLYFNQEQYAAAEALYLRGLKIYENTIGRTEP